MCCFLWFTSTRSRLCRLITACVCQQSDHMLLMFLCLHCICVGCHIHFVGEIQAAVCCKRGIPPNKCRFKFGIACKCGMTCLFCSEKKKLISHESVKKLRRATHAIRKFRKVKTKIFAVDSGWLRPEPNFQSSTQAKSTHEMRSQSNAKNDDVASSSQFGS